MFRLSRFALVLASALAASAAVPAPGPEGDPVLARGRTAWARMPLRFEANRGQWNSAVRFAARAGSYTLALTDRGASVVFADSHRVDILLENARGAAEIQPLDPLRLRTDYYLGARDRWRAAVPSYARIRYRSVYPGIDVVYYGNRDHLEYDFVIQPGADPSAIRLDFRGAAHLSLTPEGDLLLEKAGQRVLQKKPRVYQDAATGTRREISGRYRLLGRNRVAFELGNYDRRRALTIDPTITYLTYLGSTGTDQVTAVKMGPNGLLYVAGFTDQSGLPYMGTPYSMASAGGLDMFLAVLDTTPAGGNNPIYLSYLGGSGDDIPLGLDVDANGVMYLTGTTTSSDFPLAGNQFENNVVSSATQAFVVQLDPNQGTSGLLYSAYLGGSTGENDGRGIAVDSNGLIYVIGQTASTDFPITSNAYAPVLWGPADIFIAQVDPVAGTLLYSTYIGGEDIDDGRNILVGPNGLIYFSGSTLSKQFPLAGPSYSGNLKGIENLLIGVLDPTQPGPNSLLYTTYLGGSAAEEVRGMAFDNNGNLVLTGYTLSPDYPVTGDAMQSSYGGNGDAFVSVFNPAKPYNTGLLYSTFLGGSQGDVGYDVVTDSDGNFYVTGYTLSQNFPIAGGAPQSGWGGGTDIFVTKFKPHVAGLNAIEFSTYTGGSGTYVGTALALGTNGAIYVVGWGGIGLPSSPNAWQSNGYGGGVSDGFVMVIQ